jgi:hypothetical protein
LGEEEKKKRENAKKRQRFIAAPEHGTSFTHCAGFTLTPFT